MTGEEAVKFLYYIADELQESLNTRFPKSGWTAQKRIEAIEVAISAIRSKQENELNEPLTLDELRQMDGEPVWVVCDEEDVNTTPGFEPLAFWTLVEVCEESIFLTNNLGGRTEYAADVELEEDGITAYRQKPEEGTV